MFPLLPDVRALIARGRDVIRTNTERVLATSGRLEDCRARLERSEARLCASAAASSRAAPEATDE